MKARPFLAVVLAVALLLLSLAAGGWWLVLQRSPLQLQHQQLVSPRAARFVPRQAALSLYLLSDGEQPVGYARAVAPPRQRRQWSRLRQHLRKRGRRAMAMAPRPMPRRLPRQHPAGHAAMLPV